MFKKIFLNTVKILVSVILLYILAAFATSAFTPDTMNNKPLIIAHRGASGSAPENTLLSIDKALEIGVDYIEIDVHLSKDGSVMVIHDHSIDRTTNGHGEIADMTREEIQQYDAGSWWYEKNGLPPQVTHIPTLQEVLEHINGKCKLMIELKKGRDYYPGLEKAVLDIVKQYNALSWCEYHSFNDPIIENLLALDSSLTIYKLIVGKLPLLPIYYDGESVKFGSLSKRWKGKLAGVSPNVKFASKLFISTMHKNGLRCYVWTVNDDKKKMQLAKRNVDAVITNYPESKPWN